MRRVLALLLLASCGEAAIPVLDPPGVAIPGPITAGLIAHYPLDETEVGAPVRDRTLARPPGVPVNGPEPSPITAPLRFANLRSLRFDGARIQQVNLQGTFPRTDAPQTLALWFRYRSADVREVSQDLISTGDFTTSAIQFGIRWEMDRSISLRAWKRLGEPLCIAPLPVPDAWHHVAYTFDGSVHALYVDGERIAETRAVPQSGPATRVRLGNSPGGGEPFTGFLDDVRVFDRALRPEEVAQLAAGFP